MGRPVTVMDIVSHPDFEPSQRHDPSKVRVMFHEICLKLTKSDASKDAVSDKAKYFSNSVRKGKSKRESWSNFKERNSAGFSCAVILGSLQVLPVI